MDSSTETEQSIFYDIKRQNESTINDYFEAKKTETNLAYNTQLVMKNTLTRFSNYVKKNFKDLTREDIIRFLDSMRKPESEDPTHKWIGTYNNYLITLGTFLRWLYYPNLDPKERPRPDVLLNIKQLRRKEKSAYKPTDMWSQEDDLLFLKYCPSKRDRAYHTMSRDTSCRPHELLKLRIKDVVFKMAGERQYAEILVNGKTGTRSIPLINSIPYVKDLLDSHPMRNHPNAHLIFNERVFGRALTEFGVYYMYVRYKTRIFPSLLKDPLLDPNDKAKIQELLKKPWNPYIRRHSALTEKSKILKEHVLRQHAGWTATSNMHQKYVHYFGNESSESILEAYGVIDKSKKEIDKLKPKQCTNCNEPNKNDSKFCTKCRMILSHDEYTAVKEREEKNESRIEDLNSQMAQTNQVLANLMREVKQLRMSREKEKD